MSLEQEFDKRIAALHRIGNPDGNDVASGEHFMDIRHAEFQAMADVFLGEDFDRTKLERVEAMQIALHEYQAALYQRFESGHLSPVTYVGVFNLLLDCTFEISEAILGPEDFLKLFGVPRSELGGFIDEEAFLQAHPTVQFQHGAEEGAQLEYLREVLRRAQHSESVLQITPRTQSDEEEGPPTTRMER